MLSTLQQQHQQRYQQQLLVSLLMLLLKCCFTSSETVGLLGTGAQDVHLDFHTAPELCNVVGVGCINVDTEESGENGNMDCNVVTNTTSLVGFLNISLM